MKKVFNFLLAGFLLLPFLFSSLSAGADKKEEPKLKLTAHPRQGRAPITIAFHAQLEGVDLNDPEYYCLKEEWDFGDESGSMEERQCEPHSPDSIIKTNFTIEREYDLPGSYGVRLILGDKKIVSNKLTVSIHERRIQ